jgi:hypothetical protein
MIRKGFMRIFWGLLFIAVDIEFNDFDLILPDFVGYILIYTGLASLKQVHPRFGVAKPFAAVMVIVSLAEMLHINPFSIMSILGIVLDLMMIWHTCTAIIDLALQRLNSSLSETAINRRNLYLVLSITNLLVVLIVNIAPDLIGAILVPLAIFNLVVVLLVMMLMTRAAREIS